MAYLNAKNVLPTALVREIQKYIDGDTIYIPSSDESERTSWGQRNGSRQRYNERNAQIVEMHESAVPVEEIAEAFYLTCDSVRKIIRKQTIK